MVPAGEKLYPVNKIHFLSTINFEFYNQREGFIYNI